MQACIRFVPHNAARSAFMPRYIVGKRRIPPHAPAHICLPAAERRIGRGRRMCAAAHMRPRRASRNVFACAEKHAKELRPPPCERRHICFKEPACSSARQNICRRGASRGGICTSFVVLRSPVRGSQRFFSGAGAAVSAKSAVSALSSFFSSFSPQATRPSFSSSPSASSALAMYFSNCFL